MNLPCPPYIFEFVSILTATNDHDLADTAPIGCTCVKWLCDSYECFAIYTKSFFVALCTIVSVFLRRVNCICFASNTDRVDIVPMAQLFRCVLLPATMSLVDVLSMGMFKTNDNVIHASGIY